MALQLLAQSWARLAACANVDPEPFHPGRRTRRSAVTAAKALCATCPVRSECLTDALERNEEYGIWGGLDEDERRDQRRVILARSRRRA